MSEFVLKNKLKRVIRSDTKRSIELLNELSNELLITGNDINFKFKELGVSEL